MGKCKCKCICGCKEKLQAKAEAIVANIKAGDYSSRELALTGALVFLVGLVIGMLVSPRKVTMVGCNNNNTEVEEAAEEEK